MSDHVFSERENELRLDGPHALTVAEWIITAARKLDIQIGIDGDTEHPCIRFSSAELALQVFKKAAQLATGRAK